MAIAYQHHSGQAWLYGCSLAPLPRHKAIPGRAKARLEEKAFAPLEHGVTYIWLKTQMIKLSQTCKSQGGR
eukprot:12490661-Prorocentrum_lima.AAC.1